MDSCIESKGVTRDTGMASIDRSLSVIVFFSLERYAVISDAQIDAEENMIYNKNQFTVCSVYYV